MILINNVQNLTFIIISIYKKGEKALWLSNLELFEYFLKSNHKYLVAVQDDATLPENLKDILKEKYVNHPDFLGLGGTRLGQFASCNLYNKHCIKNILNSIKEYPIDRGLDHYVSNIPDPWTKEERPFNLYTSLPGLPRLLTSVNGSISKKSMRIYYDKKKIINYNIPNLINVSY